MIQQKNSIAAALLVFGFVYQVQSATIVVDAGGGGDVTSVAEAISLAFSNTEADEIVIRPGKFLVDSIQGETLIFDGDDDITLRGEDANDRPIIVVEPTIDTNDGVLIRMSGALTFENLVFVPSDNFTFLPDVDDMFAVVNNDLSDALDLTFRDVVITSADLEYNPATLTGYDDPRGSENVLRDDAINIEALGNNPVVNVILDGVVISAFGSEAASDAVVLDGPNVNLTVTGGSMFSFITRRGIFAFNANSVNIDGTAEEPVIIYGVGETLIRASAGNHVWNHLWCIGLDEDVNGINTGFAARIDPNGGAQVTANHCLFSTAINDGVFMNFGSDVPLSYIFNRCTFHNVPELIRFGFVGEPGPQDNISVTVNDSIIDNFFWTAPADGTFFSPEPTVVHYGDGDNTLANVSINNLAYNTITFVSSTSGSREPAATGNIIADAEFGFESEVFSAATKDSFLVVTNCDAFGTLGSNGSPLAGARISPCGTSVGEWSIH